MTMPTAAQLAAHEARIERDLTDVADDMWRDEFLAQADRRADDFEGAT
jgi:hypothetical protein